MSIQHMTLNNNTNDDDGSFNISWGREFDWWNFIGSLCNIK